MPPEIGGQAGETLMQPSILFVAGALSLAAGVACAQSLADNPPKTTIICLDVSGRDLAGSCRAEASRLGAQEDICLCPIGTDRVTVSVCPPGVQPPNESVGLYQARKKAVHNGSLVGATYKGQLMCRYARNALRP
jgi:hypothetical protein